MGSPRGGLTAPSVCAPQGYPPRKDMVRAVSLRTGYVVRGTGERSCCVTYLAQVDPKGGLMGSGTGYGVGWDGMGCQDRVPVNGNRSGMWKGFSTMDSARERGP